MFFLLLLFYILAKLLWLWVNFRLAGISTVISLDK